MPHIRILPHSREEFPSLDELMVWLSVSLKASGGAYLLRSANSIADLKPGSIALFRFGDSIVGEGLVRGYDRHISKDRMLTIDEQTYEARVDFAPSSIRLFSPPIPISALQGILGSAQDISVPRTYHIIQDWTVYPRLLASHVENGGTFM